MYEEEQANADRPVGRINSTQWKHLVTMSPFYAHSSSSMKMKNQTYQYLLTGTYDDIINQSIGTALDNGTCKFTAPV